MAVLAENWVMMSDLFSRIDHSPADVGIVGGLFWVAGLAWLLFFINSLDYWYVPSTPMIYWLEWVEHGQYEALEDHEKQHRWSTCGGYASFFVSIIILITFIQLFSFNPLLFAPNMLPTGLLCCSRLIITILAYVRFSRFDRPKLFGEVWFPEFGFTTGLLVSIFLMCIWAVRRLTLILRVRVNVFISHIIITLYAHGISSGIIKIFFVLDGGHTGTLVWCTFLKVIRIPLIVIKALMTYRLILLEIFRGCAQLWVFGVLVNLYGDEAL